MFFIFPRTCPGLIYYWGFWFRYELNSNLLFSLKRQCFPGKDSFLMTQLKRSLLFDLFFCDDVWSQVKKKALFVKEYFPSLETIQVK